MEDWKNCVDHLSDCDDDGYCNHCGYQDSDEGFDFFEVEFRDGAILRWAVANEEAADKAVVSLLRVLGNPDTERL